MSNNKLSLYSSLVDNANVRRALDIIAKSEDADYNTTFGGGTFDDFSKHPNIKKRFKQKDGKYNTSGAAGRYQMLKSTWDDLQSTLGLSDFSPRNQDIGAIALLDRIKGKDGKSALQSALDGNYQAMVEKAGGTWASFPSAPSSYSQPKHGWNRMNKIIASATGAQHEDVSGNGGSDSINSGGYQTQYTTDIDNPSSVVSDEGYNELQRVLSNFESVDNKPLVESGVTSVPGSKGKVAEVAQTEFIDIPAIYDAEIEKAFGGGAGEDDLFPEEIDRALRGIYESA